MDGRRPPRDHDCTGGAIAASSYSLRLVRRPLAGLVVFVLAAGLLSACGDKKQAVVTTTTTVASTTTTTTPIGPPPNVTVTNVANATDPTYVTQRPDDNGTLFVTERAGLLKAIRSGLLDPNPLLDISSDVSTDGERGLLSVAFSPTDNSKFYVYYTDKVGDIRVVEFTLGADGVADMHTKRDLLTIAHRDATNHNGGQLQFGPDNNLYVGVGDGGGSGDPKKNGQNLTVLLGKILRINVTPNGDSPYTVPYDNPFAKREGARPEVWAFGLRNPWRFSFDAIDGQDKGIWIGDVGQNNWEEVDHVEADPKGGQNYGWSLREGTHKFSGDKPTEAIEPIYDYEHTNGACSITGGYVYRGRAIPPMTGRYIFADYCNGQLMTLTQKGTSWQRDNLNVKVSKIQSFGRGNNGEIYTVSGDGAIGRLDAG